jgi:transposase
MTFFEQQERGLVGLEACGTAHYWGRKLSGIGHKVRLISAQFVRPFVKSNKSDAADAAAIWEAIQRPDMRFVAVKTEDQQAVLGLHRIRSLLVKYRTMQANQLRGLLAEFGIILPVGRKVMLQQIPKLLAETTESELPQLLRDAALEQVRRMDETSAQVRAVEARIRSWQRRVEDCKRVAEIPGIGLITATAAVAVVGEAKSFRSGREFAAFLGLVPRHVGTGGKIRMLGISKRGDRYMRTLLIHSARSVVYAQQRPGRVPDPWIKEILARRHKNVAVVALANKLARIVWAVLATKKPYRGPWAKTLEAVAA